MCIFVNGFGYGSDDAINILIDSETDNKISEVDNIYDGIKTKILTELLIRRVQRGDDDAVYVNKQTRRVSNRVGSYE